jgi:hypothetical protein
MEDTSPGAGLGRLAGIAVLLGPLA